MGAAPTDTRWRWGGSVLFQPFARWCGCGLVFHSSPIPLFPRAKLEHKEIIELRGSLLLTPAVSVDTHVDVAQTSGRKLASLALQRLTICGAGSRRFWLDAWCPEEEVPTRVNLNRYAVGDQSSRGTAMMGVCVGGVVMLNLP